MSSTNKSNEDYMVTALVMEDTQTSENSQDLEKIQLNQDDEQSIDKSYKWGLEWIYNSTDNALPQSSQVGCLENNNSIKGHNYISENSSDDTFKYSVISDGPERVLDLKLGVSSFNKWPNMLAEGCQQLLSTVKKSELKNNSQSFDVDSTIEVRPISGNCQKWEILLRMDAIHCYQKYGKRNKKIQNKFIDYTKRVFEEHKQDNGKKLNDQEGYINIPKLYKCNKQLKVSGNQCNFHVCKRYCILQTETYYATARCNKQRVITVNPHIHENNEGWVQKIETWEIICQLIDKIKNILQLNELPMKRIYINFGYWQSQTYSNDLKPNDCHAHINIELKEDAIKTCKGRTDALVILHESIFAPVDYRLLDAIDLNRYIDGEIELEQEMDTGDYFNEESNSSDIYCSFSSALSHSYRKHLLVEMHVKPSIISHLINQINKKQNKLSCDICM